MKDAQDARPVDARDVPAHRLRRRGGCSVGISGDTAIVGAFADDGGSQSGSAYVFYGGFWV